MAKRIFGRRAKRISDRIAADEGRAGGLTMYLSYRRADTGSTVGRLSEALRAHFGEHRVFVDFDSIAPGVDFVEATKKALGSFGIVLVVIGQNWLSATDDRGSRRLDNPEDWVRVELETVLERGAHVIPVLVDDASMPHGDELPPSLKPIAYRNAFELRMDRWAADIERLVATLHRLDEAAAGIPFSEITPLGPEAT